MPENTTQPQTEQPQPPEKKKSLRLQRREARMKFVKDARTPRKVRVAPANEDHRGRLAHPNAGGFRSSGSVEWPLDSFTKRRIRDGDVKVEERAQNKAEGEFTAEASPRRTPQSGGSGQSKAQSPESSPPSGKAPNN